MERNPIVVRDSLIDNVSCDPPTQQGKWNFLLPSLYQGIFRSLGLLRIVPQLGGKDATFLVTDSLYADYRARRRH